MTDYSGDGFFQSDRFSSQATLVQICNLALARLEVRRMGC